MSADTAIVIVAAGQGRRMGGHNKALLELAGEPVLAHVARRARGASCCRELIAVLNPADLEALERDWSLRPADLEIDVVADGGAERWISSRQGCRATSPASEVVLVHDAARALVPSATFDAVAQAVREFGAALAAEPLADTLKREAPGGTVAETISREGLWRAQTPQGARRGILLDAFAAWDPAAGLLPTDEAMLLESAGHAPHLVPASASNFKLTTPQDLALARAILAAQ